jgi:simple sugar transport system permease protein
MDALALLQIIESGLRLSVPLIFACLAGLWSEKSGIVDIGLEGKMLIAAFAAAVAAFLSGQAWIGVLAAVFASTLLGLLHGFASISQRGNQIISGVALNMLAAGLTALLGNVIFKQGGRSPPLDGAARLPELALGQSAMTILAISAVLLTALALARTRFGLRVRAAGENPAAVDNAGASLTRLRYGAVILAGILCGFAGATLSLGQAAGFLPMMTAGQGFVALAALIFAKWRAWPAFWTCLLFGLLDAVAIRLQGVSLPGIGAIPVQAIQALPYLFTIVLLAGFMGRAVPPRAAGQPYVKER